MAKKIEINEDWEPVEVEDLDNLFIVILKRGSFDQGYVEAFDTDDALMQTAYDSLVSQYDECGCDELTKIYLIKLPNTEQVTGMCNTGLFNGSSCDPHVIEATRDLFNRADCEQLSCWAGCGLNEGKKKKKACSSVTITTGDPALNIKHFNKCMGTDGLGKAEDHPHLIVGDTLPDAPAAESGSESAGGNGLSESYNTAYGHMDRFMYDDAINDFYKIKTVDDMVDFLKHSIQDEEAFYDYLGEGSLEGFAKYIIDNKLNEGLKSMTESLETDLRALLTPVNAEDVRDGKPHLFEITDAKPGVDKWWVEEFDDGEIDFGKLTVYHITQEEKEDGKPIATFLISGGKNGTGDWAEYLSQLADVFKAIKEKIGAEPLLYKLETDVADDVWSALVFLYDREDKVEESLNEDLIVIKPEEAKKKLTELQDQIKAEKNEKVRKSLLTLLNIYLFQTYRPSDKKGSTITDDEWQEISDWAKYAKEESGSNVDESLTEGSSYRDQVDKMMQLEAGTRGFNAKAASDDKLRTNRSICLAYKLWTALDVVETEMLHRGLISSRYQRQSNQKAPADKNLVLNVGDIQDKDLQLLTSGKIDLDRLLEASFANAIEAILLALFSGDNALTDKIKAKILSFYDITLQDLKAALNKNLADDAVVAKIRAICAATVAEQLKEDTFYSHRLGNSFELPPEVKLLNKDRVEDFVRQLAPEERFSIGYVTPVYFYKELDDKFSLVKATQLTGYTGLDYRDATGDADVPDHEERVANAQRQINAYANGAEGHALNDEGERFSATYKQTNKLTLNQKKANSYIDAAAGKAIDLSKILFYPEVGSHPKVIYFLDLKDGHGFRKVKRELLEHTLYKKVQELAFAKDNGITNDDLSKLRKLGFSDVLEFEQRFKGLSIDDVLAAYKQHMDPIDYVKQYPYSRRWTMKMFSDKVNGMLAQDAATVEAQPLDATQGMDRTLSGHELKPQVRALYTNQIYYLSGKPGTDGQEINESLAEQSDVKVEESIGLEEAKRYVKRYYVRPLNIFCGNKEDIIQALIRAGDQNCSVYSLKRLDNHEDVHLLQPSDIIYYWDDRVLYDKNHVQVMDYDLFVKHEEERKKVGNVDAISDATFNDIYDDRATENDLKDKEVITNYKALNSISR